MTPGRLSGSRRPRNGASKKWRAASESATPRFRRSWATIGATPAVVNAVLDALAALGVTEVAMPMTPMHVWRAIERARDARGTKGGDDA